jgi:cell division protein ZapD
MVISLRISPAKPRLELSAFTRSARVKQNREMAAEEIREHAPAPENETLVFEQPLSERMRTFLRLDFLYTQALYHNEVASQWGSRAAMGCLLDVLAISTRGDIRSDVLKELERHVSSLNEFQSRPGVDSGRLKSVMANLTRLRSELLNAGSTFLQPLRDSEFLSAIKHRSAIPGGTCEFDLPDYFFWLSQAADTRAQTFNEWLGLLRPLCDAIAELLWLTRQNGRARQEIAKAGSFHITFDRDTPIQLLRISLPKSTGLYPEISGSHYRCSLRFLAWNGLTVRPTQSEGDVPFILSCCS